MNGIPTDTMPRSVYGQGSVFRTFSDTTGTPADLPPPKMDSHWTGHNRATARPVRVKGTDRTFANAAEASRELSIGLASVYQSCNNRHTIRARGIQLEWVE